MIEEPYRWVEAVANRREYVEDQLRRGSPIVLLNYSDGLLVLTVSRETRKVFEIYDRIGFAALGHPADIERMRLAAIDLAHVEGFNRAVEDVSLRRLVNYGLSPALKTAFEQVFSAPFIVKMLLAELGTNAADDLIVKLDYDGSLARSEIELKEPFDVLAGSAKAEEAMLNYLVEHNSNPRRSIEDAIRLAAQTWAVGLNALDQKDDPPAATDLAKLLREHLKTRHVEAAVLDRTRPATNRFRLLDEKEIRSALKDL
ncbi:MAG: Proteasome subunit alpha [Verrucomicrobiae bacterium]|nr:Proteasome subunit alpha [Verrucomicrobiae bacterium]